MRPIGELILLQYKRVVDNGEKLCYVEECVSAIATRVANCGCWGINRGIGGGKYGHSWLISQL